MPGQTFAEEEHEIAQFARDCDAALALSENPGGEFAERRRNTG